MAERKLQTTTTVDYHSNDIVDIILRYSGKKIPCSELLPHIISSDISDVEKNLNGISIKQGDLYVLIECSDWIQIVVDNNGYLSIIVYNEDEIGYSIDADEGNLNFEI